MPRVLSPFVGLTAKWREIAACLAATMGALVMGTTLGWSSPAQRLLREDTTIKVSDVEFSLVSSLMNVGALIGGLIGGGLIGRFGRKGMIKIISIPCILGWLLIIFAQNVAMLIAGRIITGLSSGIYSLAIPIYIGECASAQVRGMVGAGFQLLITIGILLVNILGIAENWDVLNWTCFAMPVALIVIMLPMPESPAYYLKKGEDQKAKESLLWLREKGVDVGAEVQVIKDALEESMANSATMRDLLLPQNLRPFIVSMGLMLLQQLSGVNAVIFYTSQIFGAAGLKQMSSTVQAIIVTGVQVVVTGIASLIMDIVGRRVLLVLSDLFMGVSLVSLGTFFIIQERNPDLANDTLWWLPVVSLVLFIAMFSIGYGPIPWMMMGEVFPGSVRSLASSIATSFNWTLAFAVTMAYPGIDKALHTGPPFIIFGGICFAGIFFVLMFVPETKGKTLEEIQRYFGTIGQDEEEKQSEGQQSSQQSQQDQQLTP